MREASWTYEVPSAGMSGEGLGDYRVVAADGAAIGRSIWAVRREQDAFLLVERATLPHAHHRIAVPWDCVDRIDDTDISLHLRVEAAELEERALALDPACAVEEGNADAGRDELLERELERPQGGHDAAEHVTDDTRSALRSIAATVLGALLFMGTLAMDSAVGGWWWLAVGVAPLALMVAGAVSLWRYGRDPYARDRGRAA
jgi:hypothetical protein